MDDDYALALQLQSDLFEENQNYSENNSVANNHGKEPQSLIDPYWEVTDPNPDVRALFLQFNDRFFWGRLAGIEVRWSPRMTLCAGVCCYEGRGGLCSVRLSVPLLKLRPRKDLIETLLHEMIHAYLFVTDNNKDHDGHGPEFHKHMYRINKEAGTNISVYHNFHDEVDSYRQHWWRCDGPCRSRKPYFGYVKRSMNRAPSKNDTWWAEHQRTCGGTYTKVKEPEDYGKKKGKKDKDGEDEKKKEKEKSSVKSMDIRVFGGEGKTLGNATKSSQPAKTIPKFSNPIPTPNSSLNKPSNSVDKPKPSATVSRLDDASPAYIGKKYISNGHVTALPGARTPDKKGVSMNKPVSQGGSAAFKKRIIKLPDFSDSDDDDDLLFPVPSGNLSNTTIHSNVGERTENPSKEHSPWVNSNVSNVSTDCDTTSSNAGDFHDSKADASEHVTDKRDDRSELDQNKSVGADNEADDVRAMLRKVWGQKQFGSQPSKMKVKGTFKSGIINPDVSNNTGNKEINSAHKRLSGDTGFGEQASKRQKSDSIYIPNNSSDFDKNVHLEKSSSNNKITSPIDKFLKKSVTEPSSSRDQTVPTKSGLQDQTSMIRGGNSEINQINDSTGDMAACPVCSKSVSTASINEHLDLCLTMQAI
ncbi:DNA-dependent metalloprotease SPRTN-like [Mercenaria mercenaria]|uniref:DNA-dependent metalloprotease SPRTN-like n=1 Tax=Mercenaria mercenaria TaxID=6596 RepID=UPI00234EA6D9|nr:DNA-dependent metalloprotease SPRTN-like [Mercenaria mercenaria]